MMPTCEICRSVLDDGRCPFCTDALRERFRQGPADAFPFTAQAPDGAVEAQTLGRLRRSLLQGDLQQAEQQWSQILAGLRPMGAAGRRQLGDALDACAALKEHLGKAAEAKRLRQRALTARKDPSELRFKQATDGAHHWDDHAWLRAQAPEEEAGRQERIAAVQAELERQMRLQERRQHALKLGAFGIAGLASGSVFGLPVLAGGALGAGLGWAWLRRR